MLTAPRGLGTVCEKRSSADHAFAARKLPPKSAQEQQGRKNSHNGVSAAWYREWSSTTDRLRKTDTRATHRGQESGSPPKAEYICADLSSRPNFPLQSCGGPYILRSYRVSVSALAKMHSPRSANFRWVKAWGSRPSRRLAPELACRCTPGSSSICHSER